MIISARLATMGDLSTILGTEDAYDLLEVVTVDAHNREMVRRHGERG